MECKRHHVKIHPEVGCSLCEEEYETASACPECNGSGCEYEEEAPNHTKDCTYCEGTGYNPHYKETLLYIQFMVDIGRNPF